MSIFWRIERLYRAALVLLGKRKTAYARGGFVWAPYVPLQVTKVIFKPEDFAVRKGIMTRYSKSLRTDYYGTVTLKDLKDTK